MRVDRIGVCAGRCAAATVAAAALLSGCVLSQTGPVRAVADESVVFTGTLRSTAAGQAEYWFEYGTTTDYGTATEHSAAYVVVGENPESASVDGLIATTTYHYRLCSDVVTDSIAPSCGADNVVTTSLGRVSVRGSGTRSSTGPGGSSTGRLSVAAAADPGGAGYLDGVAAEHSSGTGPQPGAGFVSDGSGTVACLRVAGNLAVVGFTEVGTITIDAGPTTVPYSVDVLLAVEDNGSSGDRFTTARWNPADGCPAPSTALLDGATADSADFTISGG